MSRATVQCCGIDHTLLGIRPKKHNQQNNRIKTTTIICCEYATSAAIEFDPGSLCFNISVALVNSQLVCLQPVGILNNNNKLRIIIIIIIIIIVIIIIISKYCCCCCCCCCPGLLFSQFRYNGSEKPL